MIYQYPCKSKAKIKVKLLQTKFIIIRLLLRIKQIHLVFPRSYMWVNNLTNIYDNFESTIVITLTSHDYLVN